VAAQKAPDASARTSRDAAAHRADPGAYTVQAPAAVAGAGAAGGALAAQPALRVYAIADAADRFCAARRPDAVARAPLSVSISKAAELDTWADGRPVGVLDAAAPDGATLRAARRWPATGEPVLARPHRAHRTGRAAGLAALDLIDGDAKCRRAGRVAGLARPMPGARRCRTLAALFERNLLARLRNRQGHRRIAWRRACGLVRRMGDDFRPSSPRRSCAEVAQAAALRP
jgi:hypothetical protein